MLNSFFSRLSTGLKMLMILSAALLPLGLIAAFASIESAKSNRLSRDAEIGLVAADSARRVTVAINDTAAALRGAMIAGGATAYQPDGCRHILDAISGSRPFKVRLGLFDASGRPICSTGALGRSRVSAPAADIGTEVRAVEMPATLAFTMGNLPNGLVALGEFPDTTLTALAATPQAAGYSIMLRQGDAIIIIARRSAGNAPLARALKAQAPVASGQLSLEVTAPSTPLRAIELLTIALPIVMWLAAALIGWLVVDRLVLRPLGQLQRAIENYARDGGALHLPHLTTPSAEIRALGEAFCKVTTSLTAHEAELEQGLARQTKLTREVHHRVKNNLQVVSSLINLHARGVEIPEVRAAYASIQRRVDALAVVHRNHYAELEENRGVGLRPLIGELAANLRATAPTGAEGLAIALDLMPAYASQDVAVPIAFVVTELVELAMLCNPAAGVIIALMPSAAADRATLSIEAGGLASDTCRDHPSTLRSFRVLDGLSRQLRSPLSRDDVAGRFAIDITIVPPDADGDAAQKL